MAAIVLHQLQARQTTIPTAVPTGIPTTAIPSGIKTTAIPTGIQTTAIPTGAATSAAGGALPTTPSTSDILNGATKIATWDTCMAHSFCKWPVIIGIIIGCVIAFSLLWCLVRCACLGKDFACCCFRCLSCCCGPKRTPEGMKYGNLGSTPPTRGGGYQSHGQMHYGNDPFGQTATFEGPVHADSLPTMPSWDTAASRKIEVIEKAPESVEMEPIKEASTPRMGTSRTNSAIDGVPSPMRSAGGYSGMPSPRVASRTNSGVPGMPSPMEPSLPNVYGSGNRTPRAAASPVYGNDQYSSRGGANSGRNTPQTPYSAGGYGGRSTPRSPYGAATNSSYSNNNGGYGASSVSSYSTAHNGYDAADDYMSHSGSNYNSGHAGGYDDGYGSNKATDYSSYGAPASPYQQQSRRPVHGQHQGSYI